MLLCNLPFRWDSFIYDIEPTNATYYTSCSLIFGCQAPVTKQYSVVVNILYSSYPTVQVITCYAVP